MPGQVDEHFIKQYESELFEAFQLMGNVMRPRVRVKNVRGSSTHFPKIGTAPEALPKSRKGKVPLMDILRDRVECTVTDYYGADMIDDLDELKTNVEEKAATQRAITQSLGRTFDTLALTALGTTSNANNSVGSNDSWSTDAVPRLVLEHFGEANAIGGGENHAVISWKAWSDLLGLNSFINTEYGGDPMLTSEGQRPKMYFGFHYVPYSNLPEFSAGIPLNLWFHRSVIGVAQNKDITASTAFLDEYDATFIMGKMSLGAVLIDSDGAIKRRYAG